MKNARRPKAPKPQWHRDENSKDPLAGLHLFLSRSERKPGPRQDMRAPRAPAQQAR